MAENPVFIGLSAIFVYFKKQQKIQVSYESPTNFFKTSPTFPLLLAPFYAVFIITL
jgi:hypothetical protein